MPWLSLRNFLQIVNNMFHFVFSRFSLSSKFCRNIFLKIQQSLLQLSNIGLLSRVLVDSDQESLAVLLHCVQVQQPGRDEDGEKVAEFTPGLLEIWRRGEKSEVAGTEEVGEVRRPEVGPEVGEAEEEGVGESVGL